MQHNNYKSTAWINLGKGCINVKTELDKSDIQQILKESNLSQVCLVSKLSSKTFELLNEYLFSERPDVWLRPTAFNDFEFLKSITNLEALHIDNFGIRRFDGIEN